MANTVDHSKKSLMLPCGSQLLPSLIPWQPLIIFHPYNFFFSRMSFKRNHVIYSFLSLTSLTQRKTLKIHPCPCVNQLSVPFVAVSYCMDVSGLFIHSPGEGHLVYFQVLEIMAEVAIHNHAQVFNISFQFTSLNTQEWNIWII